MLHLTPRFSPINSFHLGGKMKSNQLPSAKWKIASLSFPRVAKGEEETGVSFHRMLTQENQLSPAMS
jgi:hypothetical protein